MQNFNRLPIISDTTRSYTVVLNPYGNEPDDIEIAGGYYVGEQCPVNGASLIAGPYETADAAHHFIREIL